MLRLPSLILLTLSLAAAATEARQREAEPPAVSPDLKRLSIEELAELDVTSVSRRVERLSQTAAAVTVIRQEDIRRSGVTSIAEAMRLADSLDVARSGARNWSISARGFTIGTANKLLVLMDGRTLYSPLFAGTFWDVQDTVLADVTRIEVVRGPGGTIWGANAVNGVINIITRDASETRGNLATLIAGTENQLVTSARHGGRLAGGAGNYRVYGKFRRLGPNVFATGESARDTMALGQFGVRLDSEVERTSRWSLQGSVYRGAEGALERDDTEVRGGFVSGLWSRRLSPGAEFQARAYYDHTHRTVPLQFDEGRHTAAVDVQHGVALGTRHNLIAGGEVRVSTARDVGASTFLFDPERRTNTIGGIFVQDEIALTPAIFATLGSKFERNDYTGVEVQPTIRLRWNRGDRETVWGAVSRAVRLPTRLDTDVYIPPGEGGAPEFRGNEEFRAESVVAYEAGYRVRAHARVSVDLAGFVNRYDDLRSQELTTDAGPSVLLGNTLNATTRGVELASNVQPLDRWRLRGSYTYLHKRFSTDPGSLDPTGGTSEGNDPPFFATMRSYLDLPHTLSFDLFLRYVGARPLPVVPSYPSLDLRLGWGFRPGWELSVIGHELLQDSHPEFGAPGPRRVEYQRGFHVRSTWLF